MILRNLNVYTLIAGKKISEKDINQLSSITSRRLVVVVLFYSYSLQLAHIKLIAISSF
jgi:choline kinase